MSIRDYKITDAQFSEKGVIAAPDTLKGTAAENKGVFDRFAREIIAPQFNAIVDGFADMEESANSWSTEEAQRVQQENARQSAEQGRVSAEGQRATNETARLSAEENRISAENDRVTAENDRVTAETARVNAENKRDSAEKSRISAETARNVWQTYDAAKTYVPGNKVSFGGSSYVCTAATIGHEPTDTAYWLLIAKKGEDGAGADDLRQINNALDAVDPTKITAKAAPADGDGVMIADSADGGKAKRLLWSNVKAALGKLFVPLARKINGKTLSADVTLTGENIAVSSTDSTPISRAVKYRVNPNLLDNWYFVNPVNQRGQTEYTAVGYTVDRWRITDGVAATLQGGALNISYTVAGWNLTTFLDNVLIPGATYTLSCLYKATGLPIRLVCSWGAGKYFFNEQAPISDDWALAEITGTIPTDASIDANQIVIQSLNTGSGSFSIKAVKLELGGTQTLAHKENDKWVLNEIPDFGEQLRRCQRYFVRLTQPYFLPSCPDGVCRISIPYPVVMRTTPSVTYSIVNDATGNLYNDTASAEACNLYATNVTTFTGVYNIQASADL